MVFTVDRQRQQLSGITVGQLLPRGGAGGGDRAAIGLLNTACDIAALRRTRHRLHWLWALTMPAYHPLATLAAYKALWELLTKPFYWDKTSHGHFDP